MAWNSPPSAEEMAWSEPSVPDLPIVDTLLNGDTVSVGQEAADLITNFYSALVGPDGDDGTNGRLGWLSALICDLRNSIVKQDADSITVELSDPPATWEAILEIEALITDARHVLKEARGDQ